MGCARLLQLTLVGMLASCAFPASAQADWLLVPFAGTAFGGETTILDLEDVGGSAKTVIGVSGIWLTDRLIGFEADLLYGPRFFGSSQGRPGSTILGSYVSTVSGGVIVAVPLAVTRESLRPYVTAGVGAMRAGTDYSLSFLSEDTTFASMHVGGGAIGFVSRRTGLRFDFRHVRSLGRGEQVLTGARGRKLSFWRLSFGVVVRLG